MKKRKPLPLYTKPARSMREYVRRVLKMLAPGRWTQKTLARDASGARVDWSDVNVTQVCLLGALNRADDGRKRMPLEDAIVDELGIYQSIPFFNDAYRRTRHQVIALVKKAARKTKLKL